MAVKPCPGVEISSNHNRVVEINLIQVKEKKNLRRMLGAELTSEKVLKKLANTVKN